MAVIFGILLFILTIFISLVTHEFGHFLVAKRFGIVADEFSIGIGKKAIFSVQKGKTMWSIRPIPLGAYCDFKDRPGGLCDLSPGKKILVYLAGPLTNILTGMVLSVIAGALISISPLQMIAHFFVTGFSVVGEAILSIGKVFTLSNYTDFSSTGLFSGLLTQFSGIQAVSAVLMMMAGLMLILGVSNLLPIPSFDGGQIVFAIPELFGKKLKQKTINKINYISFIAVTTFAFVILAELGLGVYTAL